MTSSVTSHRVLAACLTCLAILIGRAAAADGSGSPGETPPPSAESRSLADAPEVEHLTLARLAGADAWPRRALAVMRLERYGCDESTHRIRQALADPAWQVRAFAVLGLGGRDLTVLGGRDMAVLGGRDLTDLAAAIDAETNPRVLRAALRAGLPADTDRIARGVRVLARSPLLDEKLLAAELAAATADPDLRELARELTRTVILRMDRVEGGVLSPRIARLTGTSDPGRAHRWKTWLLKRGRSFELAAPALPILDGGAIVELPPERFAALETYMEQLAGRRVDLAICLDCTASMSGELAAAQRGVDDLMRFVGDVVDTFRVGLVAYRDRGGEFETRAWDLSGELAEVRGHLWGLSAEDGGDRPESVHPALRIAYTQMSWDPDAVRVLVLVGDAPPHVGTAGACVELARRGAAVGLTTHAVQTEQEPVEHFAAIAEAGEGRCVSLDDDHALVAEIAGLTLGDQFVDSFRAFFARYFELCR